MSVKTGNISLATTPQAIERCHAVMHELRPHHDDAVRFVTTVMAQITEGYRLAFLECEGTVRSVAGYREVRNLAWGHHVYVDDLVTRAEDRGSGFGGQLFDWVVAEARRLGCANLQLDSGVHRYGAHRFYLVKRMDITSHHFSIGLD